MDVERLSFTPDGFCKLPSYAGGKLSAKQFFFNKHEDIYKNIIIRSKDELAHFEVLKKHKHQDRIHIFDRACSWRYSLLKKLIKRSTKKKAFEKGSLQL
jgi:hypothetical protein